MTLLDVLRTHATITVRSRGEQYVDRVRVVEGGAAAVQAEVAGQELYDVAIALADHRVRVSCTCPYVADRMAICKHLWATALKATRRGWLSDVPEGATVEFDVEPLRADEAGAQDYGVWNDPRYSSAWRPRLTPPVPPRRRAVPAWQETLSRIAEAGESPIEPVPLPAGELLYVITAAEQATLRELPVSVERRARKKDGEWGKPQPAVLTAALAGQLPDEDDRWIVGMLTASHATTPWSGQYGGWQSSAFTLRPPLTDLLLPRICRTGRARLRQAPANVLPLVKSDVDLALTWDDGEPWVFRLDIADAAGGGWRVSGALHRGTERAPIEQCALAVDGGYVVRDGVVARLDPSGGVSWIAQLRSRGPFDVPHRESAKLVATIVQSGVTRVELPPSLRWEERRVAPVLRATIGAPNAYHGVCPIDVSFDYDGALVASHDGPAIFGEGGVVYRRDLEAERRAAATLHRYGVSGLDPRLHQQPFVQLAKVEALIHALLAEGWHVEAEGITYRSLSAPRLRVQSGIDWFELDARTDDGVDVDLPTLASAIAKGRRTIRLGDGSVGMLPEAWLARVAPLLDLGEDRDGRLRFRPSQAALIDALLAAQPAVEWDAGFVQARDALARFAGVEPLPAPDGFRGVLREYQRDALGWMAYLREFGFGGCLADDMGLGKTVMVLAMLEARRADPGRTPQPSLIVLPRSLLFNWQAEAERFVPGVQVLDFAQADRHSVAGSLAQADLVFTTYGTLRRDVAHLKDVAFDYVVLDEAQAIKNAGTATAKAVRLLKAQHRLALTGTPVENHIGEVHSLFEFLNPGLLGSGRVLDGRRRGDADERDHVARIARGLRPFILRRTKEQVAPELPPRTEETIHCELDAGQRTLYDELREHYRRVLLKQIDREGLAKSRFQILEALLRLRQAACHTGLLPSPPANPTSAKFDLLVPRLAELVAEGRKALVFSQFTSLLALLKPLLDAEGLVFEYLDGQTTDRAERVARFQTDEACRLFLISLKAGGTGLNLTAAEYVFLLDPWWNPAVEMQAIDRTHRIGQSRPVFAYRLLARDTVEERILELQDRKRALADAILDAGAGGLRGLQREDLERLLS